MKEAVLPFLGYCILQVPTTVVGFNMVRDKEIGGSEILKSWIYGQMLLFAALQVMAVPMIFLRWRFNVLFWSYVSVAAVLFIFGVWQMKKTKIQIMFNKKAWSWLSVVMLVLALLIIFYQSGIYFFGIHLDEDDARWLVEANDALEYGNMMTRNFDTGEYLGNIQIPKDVSSPWPMMIAILSRVLHTRTAVFAHTIYAPLQVFLMYAVYWMIAEELFESKESRIIFLFFIPLINLFLGKTVYTQSTFSLVRIWQGKASVAGVIIPLLIYLFLRINKNNKVQDWLKVPVVCCAACLMSGMGISIAAIMTAAYGGYNILVYRNWNRIPLVALAILPSAACLIIYTSYTSLM